MVTEKLDTAAARRTVSQGSVVARPLIRLRFSPPSDRRTEPIPVHIPIPVSVIIPTLNEAANLPLVFARLPEGLHEVIVVDGGSTDGTVEVATRLLPDVRIVRQTRRGKGNAMAAGFAAATGDIIVMLDADGSAAPEEIPAYVASLVLGADFAKGSRYLAGGGSVDITMVRSLGNKALNLAVNVLFGTRYTDLCYGYNAFWRHCLDHLDLEQVASAGAEPVWGDGFEIETLINVRIAQAGLRVVEVPSVEEARIFGESKLATWRDGLRVLRTALRERRSGPAKAPRTDQVEAQPGGESQPDPAPAPADLLDGDTTVLATVYPLDAYRGQDSVVSERPAEATEELVLRSPVGAGGRTSSSGSRR